MKSHERKRAAIVQSALKSCVRMVDGRSCSAANRWPRPRYLGA
jgi:hypothetical protein